MSRIALLAATTFAMTGSAIASIQDVSVTKLEDSYQIHVVTEEQSWVPLHPDKGIFPKLHREVTFLTSGSGQTEVIDGQEYKKFSIGKDVFAILDNCLYSDGEILFSPNAGKLIIRGNLAPGYTSYTNHSGSYRNVRFSSPAITELQKNSDLSKLAGSFVRVKGGFGRHREFVSEVGASYDVTDLCYPKYNEPTQILAQIIQPRFGSAYLFVLRKEGTPQNKCCLGHRSNE